MSKFNLRDKIESWDKKEIVRFGLFCCSKVKHFMDDKSLKIVGLIEKQLGDEGSAEREELKKAANIVANTVYTIDSTYYAACTAVYAADAITYYAAKATASITYAAHYAAKALRSSEEAVYLNYMRNKLSDIMEN